MEVIILDSKINTETIKNYYITQVNKPPFLLFII